MRSGAIMAELARRDGDVASASIRGTRSAFPRLNFFALASKPLVGGLEPSFDRVRDGGRKTKAIRSAKDRRVGQIKLTIDLIELWVRLASPAVAT